LFRDGFAYAVESRVGSINNVIAAGKCEILAQHQKAAPRIPAVVNDRILDSLGRIIPGTILANCNTGVGDAIYFRGDRAQTVDGEVSDPIIGYDDQKLHRQVFGDITFGPANRGLS
jgi:hypothetical protein